LNGSEACGVRLNTTGGLQLWNASAQIGSESAALSDNVWYRIEIRCDRTAAGGSHVADARINGVSFASSSSETFSTLGSQQIVLGNQTIGGTLTWYFDDVAWNDDTGSSQNSFPGASDGVLLYQVNAGAKDAFHKVSSTNVHTYNTSASDFPVGLFDTNQTELAGAAEFDSIAVANAATINAAHLYVISGNADSPTVVNSKLHLIAGDSATIPADDTALHAATLTSTVVNWNAIPAWNNAQGYESPDIGAAVQEVVNRGGWTSGNSMVVIWEDYGANSTQSANVIRRGRSYDNIAADAPRLYIDYTAVAAPNYQIVSKLQAINRSTTY
jgi:hypothetical protein